MTSRPGAPAAELRPRASVRAAGSACAPGRWSTARSGPEGVTPPVSPPVPARTGLATRRVRPARAVPGSARAGRRPGDDGVSGAGRVSRAGRRPGADGVSGAGRVLCAARLSRAGREVAGLPGRSARRSGPARPGGVAVVVVVGRRGVGDRDQSHPGGVRQRPLPLRRPVEAGHKRQHLAARRTLEPRAGFHGRNRRWWHGTSGRSGLRHLCASREGRLAGPSG